MKILQFTDGKPKYVEFAGDSQLATLRISDPVLTQISQGYTNEMEVASNLFPRVDADKLSGKIPAFGQEAFKIYDTTRALRGQTKQMDVTTGNVQVTLATHDLGFAIDTLELEEAAVGEDMLKSVRLRMVNDALALERESIAAAAATLEANYASSNKNTSPSTWSASGNPILDILAGREAIRSAVGRYPNVAVFDPKAWKLFITNSTVRDYIKYTQRAVVTEEIAASLLEVPKVVVGRMVQGVGAGGGVGEAALTMSDVWSQNQAGNCVLAWTGAGIAEPSYGYGLQRKGYPRVTSFRWEIINSDIYNAHHAYQDLIALPNAGFLIDNIA